MSNDEARRNTEVRMTKTWLSILDSSFDHSSFLRPSSFVLRHLDLASNFPYKEWVMLFLFTHARHRPMTRTNDRVIRQGQDLLEIISHRVFVGSGPAAHRAGKKRVADDGNRSVETIRDKRHSSRRMSPGQSRFDVDLADAKLFSF